MGQGLVLHLHTMARFVTRRRPYRRRVACEGTPTRTGRPQRDRRRLLRRWRRPAPAAHVRGRASVLAGSAGRRTIRAWSPTRRAPRAPGPAALKPTDDFFPAKG